MPNKTLWSEIVSTQHINFFGWLFTGPWYGIWILEIYYMLFWWSKLWVKRKKITLSTQGMLLSAQGDILTMLKLGCNANRGNTWKDEWPLYHEQSMLSQIWILLSIAKATMSAHNSDSERSECALWVLKMVTLSTQKVHCERSKSFNSWQWALSI